MKKIMASVIVLIMGYSAMAQSSSHKGFGLRISELANLELGADYRHPIGKKKELALYLGVKYHPKQDYDLSPNNKVENYYMARVYEILLNRGERFTPRVLHKPLSDKNVIKYYLDTESLNKYGKIIPVVTVPLQLSIRQYLKGAKKGAIFMVTGINLYAHFGQRISTVTTLLQVAEPITSRGDIVGKFKEEIETKSGALVTSTLSTGLGWKYVYKEKFFLEINPVVEYNLKFASSSIDYHGFKQVQPRVLVTIGRN